MNNDMINSTLNDMTAKISQRAKLMNSNLTHNEQLAAALTQNRNLSDKELSVEIGHVRNLALYGERQLQHYIVNGITPLREKLKNMQRSECLSFLSSLLDKICIWDHNRTHEELSLSNDAREQLASVYDSFSCGENPDLSKSEMIDLIIELSRQYAMIAVAENMAVINSIDESIDCELETDENTLQHRELMISIALNLKRTGKLPKEIENHSDEMLATTVCGMDAVHGYCSKAANGKMSLNEFACAAGNILLGLLCMAVNTPFLLFGSFALQFLSLFGFLFGVSSFMKGIYRIYKMLLPAGLSESRPAVAIKQGMQKLTSFSARLLRSAVRIVENIVSKLFSTISSLAKNAVRCAVNALENIKTFADMNSHVIT